jgi:UDP-N-acetylmuramoylalanine--D-glutamate ligase
MIVADGFRNKIVAVFGLARSGVATARSLMEGGAQVLAWDDKRQARDEAEAAGIPVYDLGSIDWKDVVALVVSPGVPLTHPAPHPFVQAARDAGAEVIGDIELFFRAIRAGAGAKCKVVCVTGTNGKSTTTALIGHLLSKLGFDAQIGGNIGRAALSLAPPAHGRVYVLEVSSFQLDLTPSCRPDVAVLLNITPDHLDRHGTMESYAASKASIFRAMGRGDTAAIGVDDATSADLCTKLLGRGAVSICPVSVGKVLGRGVYVLNGRLFDGTGASGREIRDLKPLAQLPGAHNWQNIACAYAAVLPLVRDARDLPAHIASFPGLEHRMEQVGMIGRVAFVNDSKATNADAAARALACYEDIFWIAGGKPKEGGIVNLLPFASRIKRAYLIGAAVSEFSETLHGHIDAKTSGTLEAATRAALEDAQASQCAHPIVLLSPACASFDQFRDFEHRGSEFKRIFADLQRDAKLKGAA